MIDVTTDKILWPSVGVAEEEEHIYVDNPQAEYIK